MSKNRLPPLNAVKAFEVTARTGTFAGAALELGVSATAVSQQIRNLENWFGKELFTRSANRITLTDAGRAIYPQTARALSDLAAMSTRLLEGDMKTRLVVSVPFSLAEAWLAPRLAALPDVFGQTAIDLRVEDDPVDLIRRKIDVRISYGDYHYPDLKMVPLVHDEVLPVCTAEFWHAHGGNRQGLAGIPESFFIHTNWGSSFASHPTWPDWFGKAGIERQLDPSRGFRVGLSSLAVLLARMGFGIALGQRIVAGADLGSGRLIAPFPTAISLGHPYCALMARSRAERADIRSLVELLKT
jgi:LysR family glycine cleavage system transcriptional activator